MHMSRINHHIGKYICHKIYDQYSHRAHQDDFLSLIMPDSVLLFVQYENIIDITMFDY